MRKLRARLLSPLRWFARHFGLALVIVIAGVLGGLGYGTFKSPTYSATAFVLVVGQPDAGLAAVNFAQAYARLAPLPETLAWSSKGMPPAERERARQNLQASSSPDTPLVRLTGTADTPLRAAEYANTAADALVRYGVAHQQDTGVRVALMTEADAPLTPSSPNPPMNLAVGTATGLLLGGLVAATGITSRIRRLRELAQAQERLQAQAADARTTAQVPPQGPLGEARAPFHAEVGK
jgi:hypothetical protein